MSVKFKLNKQAKNVIRGMTDSELQYKKDWYLTHQPIRESVYYTAIINELRRRKVK